mmetsp:Transcript_3627/g.4935  ORF Transcript_3627/g.4935 Transcript_3627/m.4935 type:complete len:84 (+) Transcript_3627:697-948(+)
MIPPFLTGTRDIILIGPLFPSKCLDPFIGNSSCMMLQGECGTMSKGTEPCTEVTKMRFGELSCGVGGHDGMMMDVFGWVECSS